ncbi:ROK family protein [Allorhizobium taibaishanense]|uniref:Polyphosphate glucokinase n=2 Tax=Allorhizobium taibaishanense TaxID=887144 RepID=A0A7W6HRF6_9HYPH|nr:ROK family protein [Allorhizobium taibaishanense]MBB4010060.1 polyphosphate glucokinase [Allorhizobium taibaishanense]
MTDMHSSNANAAPDEHAKKTVLSIDVGGSHVKILTNRPGEEPLRVESGPAMTPDDMVDAVKTLAKDIDYDVISIGFPGPVRANRILREPVHLGKGWTDYDFASSFGKPITLVNDALMQAVGSYEGGRMLFLGLGTGLGAALILENVAQPLEIAHLPYRHKKTIEDYVGEDGMERRGKKKWRKSVADVADRLMAAMLPDYIVIGGGNVEKLHDLPDNCRRGDNALAFEGGFRLWQGKFIIN